MILRFFRAASPRANGLELPNAAPSARPAVVLRNSLLLRLRPDAISLGAKFFRLGEPKANSSLEDCLFIRPSPSSSHIIPFVHILPSPSGDPSELGGRTVLLGVDELLDFVSLLVDFSEMRSA